MKTYTQEDVMRRVPYCFGIYCICVVCAVFILESCSSEKPSETAKEKEVVKTEGETIKVTTDEGTLTVTGDAEKGQVNIKTDDGETIEMSYGSKTIPENFPKDVPVYTPSQIRMTQVVDENKSVISLTTGDEIEKVTAFYKKELTEQGWTIKNEMSMGAMSLIQAEKEKRILNLTVNKKDGETALSLIVGASG
jgi:hypothetical protein